MILPATNLYLTGLQDRHDLVDPVILSKTVWQYMDAGQRVPILRVFSFGIKKCSTVWAMN